MLSIAAFTVSLFTVLVAPADANAFLGTMSHPRAGHKSMAKSTIEQMFSSEIGPTSVAHITAIQDDLRPTFEALPKNSFGNLDPEVTRYALHRYFERTFGWYVVGLEPGGDTLQVPSVDGVMKDRVPSYIQSLFEDVLHGHGFGLKELAVFVAILLDIVNKESLDNLLIVYDEHDASPSDTLAKSTMKHLIHDYIVLWIHGDNSSSIGGGNLNFRKMEQFVAQEYIIWEDVAMWAQDFFLSTTFGRMQQNPFVPQVSFDGVSEFARGLGQHFGAWQNMECSSLKSQLMEMEYKGTGRVRLSEYYAGWSRDDWHFIESSDYLRALGALDESDPSSPSVIIPNMLVSRTNCVTPSDYYLVCCLNECEDLIGSLERSIAGWAATPHQIAEAVSKLPSDTVDAPRILPQVQRARLEEIAKVHGGVVPLHGRLFAQWMHHAYPRECPYPHLSGTTNPVSPSEWESTGGEVEASSLEMRLHAARRDSDDHLHIPLTPEEHAEALPWNTVEELLVSQPRPRSLLSSFLRIGFLVVFVVSAFQAARVFVPADKQTKNWV